MSHNISAAQARQYAEFLLEEHIGRYQGIEIHEAVYDFFEDEVEDLTTDDFTMVLQYIKNAKIIVEEQI